MSTPEEYVASKASSASYRPKGYGISPGLQRARLRFRTRNLVTGVAIASFVVGVWAYSISAVKQDVFDDVDAEARALNANARAPERAAATVVPVGSQKVAEDTAAPSLEQDANVSNRPRGLVFAALGDRHSWLFEPNHKTLIWGAPPVDNPGRIQDKVVADWER